METIVNRRLMDVNRGLIALASGWRTIKPMVDNPWSASIRAERKRRGISLEQFAQLVGFSAQAVHKWELGGNAKPKTQREVAAQLGKEPGELVYPGTAMARLKPEDRKLRMIAETLAALPEPYQEMWVSLGHWLVEKSAPRGRSRFGRGKGQIDRRQESKKS